MPTTEHTINDALAEVLRGTRRAWRSTDVVRSENTGMLRGNNARPDILILEPNVSPVVIETEVMPAATVEPEAIARLGQHIRTTGRTILSSIAVRMPVRLRQRQGAALQSELAAATDFDFALYTGSDTATYERWPRSGWIQGSAANLSILAQSASVPPEVIDAAANQLVVGVSEAAGMIGEMAAAHAGAIHQISVALYQEDGEQTRRMAATILANAFIFHGSLAGGAGALAEVNSVEQLRGASGNLTKSAILAEWRKILRVNYWPIFDIARRILEVIPAAASRPLIEGLAETADNLLENQLMRSHDLTGAVFQRLIADRKFLAAYYTTPASAALLVGLAVKPDAAPNGGAWSNPDNVTSLRIADFACGTGTLLTTAYQRVSQLHELAGGNSESLHPQMMASALVGCDVFPSAAHLTASMLAGAHPTVRFEGSSIMTVAFGRQPGGEIALGSLDLLEPQGTFEVLAITATSAEGMGEAERVTWQSLPHSSFDVVVMNPPFTRPTVHEADRLNVPNPMFAAFGSSAEEQRQMARATERLIRGTFANGNAGLASIFLLLADRKLRAGGTLALVMPLSVMLGDSWDDARAHLANNYSNLVLVTLAGARDEDMSFSADTDMGECIVVGTKARTHDRRATFVVLRERPAYPLLGASAAKQIRSLIAGANLRRLEDGPLGGTPLYFGDDLIGQAMDAPLPETGIWNLARIADLSLAQVAYQLVSEQRVWLPTMAVADAVHIPITTVGQIGELGPIHRDINGTNPDRSFRGPFDTPPITPGSVPTYPVLWAHDAQRERTIMFDADCEGVSRRGATPQEQAALDLKVRNVWNTASHCHCNLDFRFNSQSTAMQFTPRLTIGGRAWLSVKLSSVDEEKALVLWANTSLGLLLRWWHSNKQQAGRGNLGKSTLQTMPVLDVSALSQTQLAAAIGIFDAVSSQSLLPAHEMDNDAVRRQIDEDFARDVLGLAAPVLAAGGPLDVLRMKLSQEPSIRGGR